MNAAKNWEVVHTLCKQSFRSSLHFSVATVGANGEPHVTPIGSLILDRPGHGFYFEEFPEKLARNLETSKQVCVLAVNSSRWFWLRSLLRGSFTSPPAIRLHGVAGELREATGREVDLWQRRVRRVRFSRGHAMMWRDMRTVRDIEFKQVEPVNLGEMTRDAWQADPGLNHA